MGFDRHAYLGRDDDRDDPRLRTRDPRAGWVPRGGGGLDHDPSFYRRPPPESEEHFITPGAPESLPYYEGELTMHDDSDALGQSSIQSAQRLGDPDADVLRRRRRRSDVAIYSEIQDVLDEDGELDTHAFPRLDVYVRDGEVELRGVAPDAEQRARVAELCAGVSGVVDVFNMLRILHGPRPPRGRVRWRAERDRSAHRAQR